MRLFSSTGNDSRHHLSPLLPRLVVSALIALLVISLLLAVNLAPSRSTPHANAATWTQIWSDEFNGSAGSGVDTSNWKYDTGTGFGTGEIETMTTSTSNVHQDGAGHLVITALRDGSGNWTSGRIETQRSDFGPPTGGLMAVEASIQQPNVSGAAGEGYWPAFWMLGAPFRIDGAWPKDGEVDILEDVNGLSSVYGTLHCGVSPGGPCNETSGIGSGKQPCPGCQTAFHTYRVEIDRSVSPEQIRWYLDGTNYFTVRANQVDATTWANAVDHAFFVIFDLAMGGGFPNGVAGHTTPTSATASGASMLVDYVRVFTSPGSAPSPTPTSGGSGGPIAINAGGAAAGNFQADQFFTGGTAASTTNTIDTSGVTNPAPQAVYQSERYGNFSYTIPGLQSGASYTVRLHFAEFYWSKAGQRVFNVSINGTQVLNNFDIIATAGAPNKATVQQFNATANSSGQITIQFSTVVDNAKVSGIEIIQGSSPTPTPTTGGCSGSFNQGIVSTGSSTALAWFQPCGWTAGYVILHYTVPNVAPQNVNMSYNSSTARWEFSISGISSGTTVQYSFTYQQNGVQHDTSGYSWTHP